MRRGIGFFAAGLGMAVLLGGCSKAVEGVGSPAKAVAASAPAPPPATTSAVDWIDGFCGSMLAITPLEGYKFPAFDPGDLPAMRTALTGYFATAEGALNEGISSLTRLPAAPVAAGDKLKATTLATFTQAYQLLKAGDTQFRAAPLSVQSLTDAQTVISNAGKALAGLTGSLEAIQASPELDQAGDAAPNCQKL